MNGTVDEGDTKLEGENVSRGASTGLSHSSTMLDLGARSGLPCAGEEEDEEEVGGMTRECRKLR